MTESKSREFSKIGSFALTAGGIIVPNGSDFALLGVGSDGQKIVADSSQGQGVAWKDDFTTTTFNTLSSATLGELTTIPATCTKIEVILMNINNSATAAVYVQIGDASGYAAVSDGTRFVGSASTTAGSYFWGTTAGPIELVSVNSGEYFYGRVVLTKDAGSNLWQALGFAGATAGAVPRNTIITGYADNAATAIDRLKITCSAGTFSAGSADVRVYTN